MHGEYKNLSKINKNIYKHVVLYIRVYMKYKNTEKYKDKLN